MYILASHDIEMAYETHRREAARRSQPHRRYLRNSPWLALGEAMAWAAAVGYCLTALTLD
jgi:hypothetical protein